LNKYLREILDDGLIKPISTSDRRYSEYHMTRKGKRTFCGEYERLNGLFIDLRFSGFVNKIQLQWILEQIIDPYEKLEFINITLFNQKKDGIHLLNSIKMKRLNNRLSKYILEVNSIKREIDIQNLERILENSSIYSISQNFGERSTGSCEFDINSMILEAEFSRRIGDIQKAKGIYDRIIQRCSGLDPNTWLLCFTGIIQCLVYMNLEKEGLDLLDESIKLSKDSIESRFLIKIKADIIQHFDRQDEASDLYKSCLGLFQKKDFPIIRASILNNLGVIYFRKNDIDASIILWEESRDILKGQGFKWSFHMTSINLADAYSLKGNTKRALRILGEARTFLNEVGDLEGVSEVDFNMALVQLERCDLKKAEKYYKKAEEFPLLFQRKREERKNVFMNRKIGL
jgi:tetratricopeptide (TPR) repeat protein